MKKSKLIFLFLSAFLFYTVPTSAQIIGRSDFGTEGAPQSNGVMVWGGGTNACSDASGAHVCGLRAPGYTAFEGYAPDGTTLVTYYMWLDPYGDVRISSGSAGDASTGYGIPTDEGFDLESSGEKVNK